MPRRGDWILTFSGKVVYPLDPDPLTICIEDIAHSLALQSRWGGHVRKFHSIAAHSVFVSYLVAPCFAKRSQLHDASEAYLIDIPRPLKRQPEFAPYRAAEENLMRVICGVFGVDFDEPLELRLADDIALATEIRDLMPPSPQPFNTKLPPPSEKHVVCLPPEEAEKEFLARFHELWGTR